VDNDQHPYDHDNPGDYAFPDLHQPHGPARQEHDSREAADDKWKRRQFATNLLIVVLTAATVAVGTCQQRTMQATLNEMQRQQRALIGFGSKDGQVAKYIPPTTDGHNGGIVLYFHNAGREPARVNVDTWTYWQGLDGIQLPPPRYLFRYRIYDGPTMLGTAGVFGAVVPAESGHEVILDGRWIPDATTWAEIRSGARELTIDGTIDYCDRAGEWRCERFGAKYVPPPIDGFVRDSAIELPCNPDASVIPDVGAGMRIERLHPCEQPGEQPGEDQRPGTQALPAK